MIPAQGGPLRAELVITTGGVIDRRFHPLQGRRGGQRASLVALPPARAEWIGLLRGHRQQRIAAQIGMIIQIFVAERQPEDPLGDQCGHAMLDRTRIPSGR